MITKRQLLKILRQIQKEWDKEDGHMEADKMIIEYINDPLITKEYNKIDKWYA